MARAPVGFLCFTVALGWCVATADAYTVSVVGPGAANESDIIMVDVVLDTEGQIMYGYAMQVYYNPMVLSSWGGTYHPIAGEAHGSLYAYPDNWYISSISWAAAGPLTQSVASLLFHVTGVYAYMTDIIPVVTALVGAGGTDFSGSTTVIPLSINVSDIPELSTALLIGFGLAGLGAWRRRAA